MILVFKDRYATVHQAVPTRIEDHSCFAVEVVVPLVTDLHFAVDRSNLMVRINRTDAFGRGTSVFHTGHQRVTHQARLQCPWCAAVMHPLTLPPSKGITVDTAVIPLAQRAISIVSNVVDTADFITIVAIPVHAMTGTGRHSYTDCK